jgi:hypothetical protein
MAKDNFFSVEFDSFGVDESVANDVTGFDDVQNVLFEWCKETTDLMVAEFDNMPFDKYGQRVGRSTGNLRQKLVALPVEKFGEVYTAEISSQDVDYWAYFNYGVQGRFSTTKAPNSPFRYKDKMPPLSAMQTWGMEKGYFTGLDEQQRESLAKSIRWQIYSTGIKARPFIEPVLTEKHIQKLTDNLGEFIAGAIAQIQLPKTPSR